MCSTYNSVENDNFQDESLPPTGLHETDRQEWFDKRAELTEWMATHLVNRDDCYGSYYRDQTGQVRQQCIKEPLDSSVFLRHWQGNKIIGLYSFNDKGLGKWLCIDIDAHDGPVQENRQTVQQICHILTTHGIWPIVEHSNGKYGFHIWLVFNKRVSVSELHSVGKFLTQTHEVFPKQATQTPYGSFVRLPGKHHKTEWFSQIMDNMGEWHHGTGAVRQILNATINDWESVPASWKRFVPPERPRDTEEFHAKSADGTDVRLERYKGDLSTLDILKLSQDRLTGKSNGNAHHIHCPWKSEHSEDTGGTSVFVNEDGRWPEFFCHHAHCKHRRLLEYLATFDAGDDDACCSRQMPEKTPAWDGTVDDGWQGLDTKTIDPQGIGNEPCCDVVHLCCQRGLAVIQTGHTQGV